MFNLDKIKFILLRRGIGILLLSMTISCQKENENVDTKGPSHVNIAFDRAVQMLEYAKETNNPNGSVDTARKILEYCRASGSDSLLNKGFMNLALKKKDAGEYDSALFYYNQSYALSKKLNDRASLADYYRLTGIIYRMKGSHVDAFNYYHQAALLYEALGDSIELAMVFNSMGVLYNGGVNVDFTKALSYFEKSADLLYHLNDSAKMTVIYVNMAHAYNGLHEYDKAIKYLQSNIDYLRRQGNERDVIINLQVLSHSWIKKNKHDKALQVAQESLELSKKLNSSPELLDAYQQLSTIYYYLNDHLRSIEYAMKTMNLAKKIRTLPNLMYSYYNVQLGYHNLGKADSAYKYLMLYTNLRDTIQNESKAKKLVEMETRFETERKDVQIKLLTAESENASHRLKIQTITQIGLISLIVILLSFGIYVIYNNRQKHKLEEKILVDQIARMKDLVWKLSKSHSSRVEVGLEKLNNKLINPLSNRELDVLKLVLSNRTNQEISNELFISVNTVKFHLRNIYEKMAVTTRKEAVEYIIDTTS